MQFCMKHWNQIRAWNDDKAMVATILTVQLQFEYLDMTKFNGDVFAFEKDLTEHGGCIYCYLPTEKSAMLMKRVFDEAEHPSRDMVHK